VRWGHSRQFLEVIHETLPNVAVTQVFNLTLEFVVAMDQMLSYKPPDIRPPLTKPLKGVGGNGVSDSGFQNPGRGGVYRLSRDCLFTKDITGGYNCNKYVPVDVCYSFELDQTRIQKKDMARWSSIGVDCGGTPGKK